MFACASLVHAVTRTIDGSEMKYDIQLPDISALGQLLWLLIEVLYFINTQKRNSVRLNLAWQRRGSATLGRTAVTPASPHR